MRRIYAKFSWRAAVVYAMEQKTWEQTSQRSSRQVSLTFDRVKLESDVSQTFQRKFARIRIKISRHAVKLDAEVYTFYVSSYDSKLK